MMAGVTSRQASARVWPAGLATVVLVMSTSALSGCDCKGEPVARRELPALAQASLAAAPPWASHRGKGSEGYAPQLEEEVASRLFAEAPSLAAGDAATPAGLSSPGLWICEITYFGQSDRGLLQILHQDPELDVEATFGNMPKLVAHGPDDQRHIHTSYPLLSFSPGEPLLFDFYDRDEASRDALGWLKLAAGEVMAKRQADLAIECRKIAGDAVERQLARELVDADRAFDKLAEMKTDLADSTLGLHPLQSTLRTRLYRLAALVGWADPRLRPRIERAAQVEALGLAACATFINHEADTRPRGGSIKHRLRDAKPGEYAVELETVDCGEGAARLDEAAKAEVELLHEGPLRCVLRFRVQNVGSATLEREGLYQSGWKVVVGFADGHTRRARELKIENPAQPPTAAEPPTLPPHATGTVVFGVGDEKPQSPGAARPRLVVMNPFQGDGPIVFSLDAPVVPTNPRR